MSHLAEFTLSPCPVHFLYSQPLQPHFIPPSSPNHADIFLFLKDTVLSPSSGRLYVLLSHECFFFFPCPSLDKLFLIFQSQFKHHFFNGVLPELLLSWSVLLKISLYYSPYFFFIVLALYYSCFCLLFYTLSYMM